MSKLSRIATFRNRAEEVRTIAEFISEEAQLLTVNIHETMRTLERLAVDYEKAAEKLEKL